MKQRLCNATWRLNFAELILTQMGKTVEVMQQQVGLSLPDNLRQLYTTRPYMQFAYFLAIYTGDLKTEEQADDFERSLDARLATLPQLHINFHPDNTWTAQMPTAIYNGAWQLFGTSRLIVTVQNAQPLRTDLAVPEGWQIQADQLKGPLLNGFNASIPLALPQALADNLPITWRFDLLDDQDAFIRVQPLSQNPQEEATTMIFYAE